MFTEPVQKEIEANSMQELNERKLRGKTFSYNLTRSGEIVCGMKDWKVTENRLKISDITASTQ